MTHKTATLRDSAFAKIQAALQFKRFLVLIILAQPLALLEAKEAPGQSTPRHALLQKDAVPTATVTEFRERLTSVMELTRSETAALLKKDKKRDKTESEKIRQANKYRRAAKRGYALAQYNLGQCYKNGEGVTQDDTQAVYWFRKAAEQGLASAQNTLGICYKNGKGVTQNYAQAAIWFHKAANQGNVSAQYNLGVCYDNGYGVKQDYTQAVYWYRKVADQGNASAQYNLGVCYDNGYGVKQDYA